MTTVTTVTPLNMTLSSGRIITITTTDKVIVEGFVNSVKVYRNSVSSDAVIGPFDIAATFNISVKGTATVIDSALPRYTPTSDPASNYDDINDVKYDMILLGAKDVNNNFTGIFSNKYSKPIYSANARKNRVCLMGDSNINNGFLSVGSPQLSSVVVLNGVMTVVMQAGFPHYLTVNSLVSIFNTSDLTFTSPLNGAVQQVISTLDSLTFSVSATFNGKTLADGTYTSQLWSFLLFQTHTLDNSWYRHLYMFTGGKFITTANYSLGGTISSFAVNMISNALAGNEFDYVFLNTGTNDITGAATAVAAIASADRVYADIKTIVDTFTGLGKVVIVATPAPVGATVFVGNAQFRNIAFAYLRNKIISLGKTNDLMDVIDVFGTCINGNSTTGDFITGYTNPSDQIHISVLAMVRCVKNFLATSKLKLVVNPVFNSPVTVLEDKTNYPQTEVGANLQTNSMMTGAVAVGAVTGLTGTKPTGWVPQASGGTSTHVLAGGVTRYSKPNTNLVNQGKGCTLVSTWGTTQGDSFTSWLPDFSANMVAGKWYQYSLDVTNIGGTETLSLGGLGFQLYLNNIVNVYCNRGFGYENGGFPIAVGETITLSTEPFFVPVGTNFGSLCTAIISVTGSGIAGTTSLEFSSAQMRIIDNPYV